MDYRMIEAGDRVLVCVSGGADSLALLNLLNSSMIRVPDFSIVAITLDMGFNQSENLYAILEDYIQNSGIEYVMEKTEIGRIAHSSYNKKNPCFLCTRLRRRRIFEIAEQKDCNKIAFAHHKDDIIVTLLINLFFGREISTMMPNQPIFGGKLNIIRPLAYVAEDVVKKYTMECGCPCIENPCPTSRTSKRQYIKNIIKSMEKDNHKIRDNIWRALGHIKPDYLPKPNGLGFPIRGEKH
jgi:tRNA 2-thiocytidine biosynthesis protein TtcA